GPHPACQSEAQTFPLASVPAVWGMLRPCTLAERKVPSTENGLITLRAGYHASGGARLGAEGNRNTVRVAMSASETSSTTGSTTRDDHRRLGWISPRPIVTNRMTSSKSALS